MEDSVKVIIAVISFILIIISTVKIMNLMKSDMHLKTNEIALDKIAESCQYSCKFAYGTRNVIISLSKGSILFTQNDKICYKRESEMRCRLCDCNVTDSLILNLSSNTYINEQYEMKCQLNRAKNVTISCS